MRVRGTDESLHVLVRRTTLTVEDDNEDSGSASVGPIIDEAHEAASGRRPTRRFDISPAIMGDSR